VCNDLEDFAVLMSKTSWDNMKDVYCDLWTHLKKESIGKKGKDIFELLIRRSNEYKQVNKDNVFETELSRDMFKEELQDEGD